tara:strand:- start:1447 stop:1836 length:390 start_codon:yes stop_codon:yes gene_type:complete
MNYREIKLASGKIVTLERFKMEFIYDGILVGNPNKEINDRIISDAIKEFKQNKVLVLMDDAYASEDLLKPIMITVGLTSQPINDSEGMFDGSYLNIIWFSNDLKTNSIDKMIVNLESFEWNTEAENYQF